ncbi:FadR/GntR family transcriptional regulator [Streptantibioticus cattleyicolor]|uniref:Transcriptional regulator NanR n=1 Tax=Streptantibioticus cattleyicolor (strain ATCC 35852 / DSM 46488 / JCM 4925 / NBRC 14057 / NRRL 8057) TaxID=1003195 RepID=F8JKA0_STREN|nr:FCD domain-containing protein [Streptantibioticus cattleyicolor]AEW98540.1 transcriptional regulator NanR [Streptantibioticus cattleyicolor NRRL 8057 = DSM 46488]CCB72403.1 conserved protein of unknown function [Streptantibioticus cattleyicolor NRRL 8057 = DSM 46488]
MSDKATPAPAAPAPVTGERWSPDHLIRHLCETIRTVGVGNRLPSERALAERLDVSRTALRDRIQLLEGLGILRRVPGSGTYVQALDSSGLALVLELAVAACGLTATDLLSVRAALERQAAIELAAAGDPGRLTPVRAALEAMETAVTAEENDTADREFHDALLCAAGNPALSFFADALRRPLRELTTERNAAVNRLPDNRSRMTAAHRTLYRAVAAGNPAEASSALDETFRAPHGNG